MKTIENKKPIAAYYDNYIGAIIDSGKDEFGQWFRLDSDGIRESHELIFLFTKTDIKNCQKQLNANISPSTKILLNI